MEQKNTISKLKLPKSLPITKQEREMITHRAPKSNILVARVYRCAFPVFHCASLLPPRSLSLHPMASTEFSDDSYEEDIIDPESFPASSVLAKPVAEEPSEGDGSSSELSSSVEIAPQHSYATTLPEVIKFVTNLLKYIKEQDPMQIHHLYESVYNKTTEKYFKQSPWPHIDSIRAIPHPEGGNKYLVNSEKGMSFIIFLGGVINCRNRFHFHYSVQGTLLSSHLRQVAANH